MLRQKTIRRPVDGSGIGLHSGNRVDMRLLPAPIDSGIVFRRSDLTPAVEIPANADLVRDTMLCTALVNADNVRVATIEHLMSALYGLGIDNIIIEVSAPEIPIMDGSAAPFVYLLQQAGIQEQDAAKRFMEILEPIEVRDGDKWARLVPFNGMRFDFTIDFTHPVFRYRNAHIRLDVNTQDYVHEISRARTFGFLQDIEYLHSNGLALGGSLDNAVVVDEFRVMNERGLRYDDEFARHKLLDAMGDLYLIGAPIRGWYVGYKSGHDLNNKLALAMLERTDAWRWREVDGAEGASDTSVDPLLNGQLHYR
ncbi:UDP-3-O-acyl-N-acetylglucosamine deacetylase [Suttonella sp. R2A3]|uniref:UDP-3-O-acyl-N-acetylglucosamine deacetylase n=1 Tax=Suttonella sp. R2A3 TaxID=2908648 RepID=UPI001F20AEF8|nr:UDP-3-O-acyl-N-acetylglucosamine deacetylase [Suttonella sp. R2A3]UJF24620.1 UDP-3-O-acyl-N-acetylglucosamine deacetylase [Suttonella sp. R2A3]